MKNLIQNFTAETRNKKTKQITGFINLDVTLSEESCWLTQEQLSKLFNIGIPTISYHIKNIIESGELEEKSVIQYFLITTSNGKTYNVEHYNLEMIISLGFRINSLVAIKLRKWVNAIIKNMKNKNIDIASVLVNMKVDSIEEEGYVYYIQEIETGNIKIGVSKDPERRLKQLQIGNSSNLKLIKTEQYKNRYEAFNREYYLHCANDDSNIHGEWFDSKVIE